MPLFCASCERPFRIRKTGAIVENQTVNAEPYQIFHADVWECPTCGLEVIKTADEPWTEKHKPDYAEEAAKADYVTYG